jgi:hypothetical protein
MMKKIVQLIFIIAIATVTVTYSYKEDLTAEQLELKEKELEKIEEKIRTKGQFYKDNLEKKKLKKKSEQTELDILKDEREILRKEISGQKFRNELALKNPNNWPAEKHKEYKLWFNSEYSKMTPKNQKLTKEFVEFWGPFIFVDSFEKKESIVDTFGPDEEVKNEEVKKGFSLWNLWK